MKCPKCQASDLPEGTRVCPHCGANLPEKASSTEIKVDQTVGKVEGGEVTGVKIEGGRNTIQIGSIAIPLWTVWLVAVGVILIAVVVIYVAVSSQAISSVVLAPPTATPTPTSTPTLAPTPTATPLPASRFNIAVASVGILDSDGQIQPSTFGLFVTNSILDTLRQQYAAIRAQVGTDLGDVLIWPDHAVADVSDSAYFVIEGATPEERAASAAAFAERVNADMVIFGYLSPQETLESLKLEFYYETPIKAGEPDATTGGHELGTPIDLGVSALANEGVAKTLVSKPLELRTTAIFYLTQALAYELAGQNEEALALLRSADTALQDWDRQDGKEVLYLFTARVAAAARDFDLAIESANTALEIDPDYASAYGVLGGALMDRAQLFFVRGRPLTDEEAQCTTPAVAESVGAATLADAVQDMDDAVANLEQGIAVAPDAYWPPLEGNLHMLLGYVYRLQGQERIGAGDLTGAAARLDAARAALLQAHTFFPTDQYATLHGSVEAGLGVTQRLQAHIRYLEAQASAGETVCLDHRQATVDLLNQAIGHYQACLDLGRSPQALGNPVFQESVVTCACTPYLRDAETTLQDAEENLCKEGASS